MAITILDAPDTYCSGYNPIIYQLDSTNKTNVGFRYIIEVFDTSANKLAEFSVAPDPLNNNYGNIDISRLIQNKLSDSFTTTSFNNSNAAGSHFTYDIEFGESYTSNWAFDDYIYLGAGVTGIGLTTDSAYGAGFSNDPHPYQVGDQIKVALDTNPYGDNRDLLNTYFEVIDVVDTKTVAINGDYFVIGAALPTPGVATFADNSKVRFENLASHSSTVINTAMELYEYSLSGGSLELYDTDLSDPNTKLLTDQPDVYKITPDQFVFFHVLNSSLGNKLIFENSNGDIFSKTMFTGGTLRRIGVGAGNLGTLTTVTGTAPLVKPDTTYYTVYLADSSDTKISKEYKFLIDNRCVINDTQIMFKDKKGAFNSFAFQLRQKVTGTTDKKSYNRFTDATSTTAKGLTTYYSTVSKSMNLTTNFMGEKSNLYFEQLLTSRDTYIRLDGVWYACTVTDTTFENEYERNNKFIKKSINVKASFNNPIN